MPLEANKPGRVNKLVQVSVQAVGHAAGLASMKHLKHWSPTPCVLAHSDRGGCDGGAMGGAPGGEGGNGGEGGGIGGLGGGGDTVEYAR